MVLIGSLRLVTHALTSQTFVVAVRRRRCLDRRFLASPAPRNEPIGERGEGIARATVRLDEDSHGTCAAARRAGFSGGVGWTAGRS